MRHGCSLVPLMVSTIRCAPLGVLLRLLRPLLLLLVPLLLLHLLRLRLRFLLFLLLLLLLLLRSVVEEQLRNHRARCRGRSVLRLRALQWLRLRDLAPWR